MPVALLMPWDAWWGWWLLAASAVLLGWAVAARRLLDNPRSDVEAGLAMVLMRVYVRLVHRLRVEGVQHVPRSRRAGPLVVVSNHVSGVDPLLIQSACAFEVRFMMAADMQVPWLDWLWAWTGVIAVSREGGDTRAAREAIRYLKGGGVVGIFPEGRIVREPRTIVEFLPGVGLIIARSRAQVLPVVIEGPPSVDSAWGALWRRSRSVIRFLEPVDYRSSSLDAHAIASDIRSRMCDGMGWSQTPERTDAA